MAGRSQYGSSTMIATNTPSADLAFSNLAYCSSADLRNFIVPGSRLAYALVGDTFVLSVEYPFALFYFFFVAKNVTNWMNFVFVDCFVQYMISELSNI